MSETYTKVIELGAEIENLSPDEAFLTLPPSKVQVQVQGEGLELIQMFYKPPDIVIDAAKSQVNLIEVVSQRLPSTIRLDRVTPPIFILQKEVKVNKKVPIGLNALVETPLTHDMVIEPSIFPDSVEISGAESIISQVQSWPTIYFEETDLKDTLDIDLNLVDSLQGLIDLSVNSTKLNAIAEQFTEGSREIEVLIRDVPSLQNYITLEPPVLEVRFKVPLSQFQRAQNARDFLLSVSYGDIRDDTTGFVTPHIELPENILFRDVTIIPEKLRYFDVLLDE